MWKEIKLKYIFDLKGSLINRETKILGKFKSSMTLKDINLLTIRKQENLFKFSLNDRTRIMQTIEKDALVLKKQNIMDYSLLLAVEKNQIFKGKNRKTTDDGANSTKSELTPKLGKKLTSTSKDDKKLIKELRISTKSENISAIKNSTFFIPSRHRFLSYSGEYIYHIAIIDYLQEYNLDKKGENFAKSIFRGKGAEISAVPPDRYMQRYVEFMRDEVVIDDKNRSSKSQTTD
jgi:hypothetical protein